MTLRDCSRPIQLALVPAKTGKSRNQQKCFCHLNLILILYFYYNQKMENKSVVNALTSLAQESRLDIFRLLVQAGPEGISAGKISEMTGIPPSTMSFHLKELAYADMVHSRQKSRFVIYSANFTTMNALLGFLTENCCGGNPCTPVTKPACSTPENCQHKEPA